MNTTDKLIKEAEEFLKENNIDLANTVSYYDRMDNDEPEITNSDEAEEYLKIESNTVKKYRVLEPIKIMKDMGGYQMYKKGDIVTTKEIGDADELLFWKKVELIESVVSEANTKFKDETRWMSEVVKILKIKIKDKNKLDIFLSENETLFNNLFDRNMSPKDAADIATEDMEEVDSVVNKGKQKIDREDFYNAKDDITERDPEVKRLVNAYEVVSATGDMTKSMKAIINKLESKYPVIKKLWSQMTGDPILMTDIDTQGSKWQITSPDTYDMDVDLTVKEAIQVLEFINAKK